MISRTRNECATRMIAPTLKGFFDRWTAMRRGVRRRSSSRLISAVGRSNGGTYMDASCGVTLEMAIGCEIDTRKASHSLRERGNSLTSHVRDFQLPLVCARIRHDAQSAGVRQGGGV